MSRVVQLALALLLILTPATPSIAQGTIRYIYDELGRLVGVIDGGGGRGSGSGADGSGTNSDDSSSEEDRYKECMENCLKDMAAENLDRYLDGLTKVAIGAPIIAVGICGGIAIFEPWYAPLFPQCTVAVTGSNAAFGAAANQARHMVETLAAYAGCMAGCKGW
jgi:hypothetical protein